MAETCQCWWAQYHDHPRGSLRGCEFEERQPDLATERTARLAAEQERDRLAGRVAKLVESARVLGLVPCEACGLIMKPWPKWLSTEVAGPVVCRDCGATVSLSGGPREGGS